MNARKKQRIEIVGLLVGIWFILSLPLPWLITVPDVAQQQLLIIVQMTGLISIPLCIIIDLSDSVCAFFNASLLTQVEITLCETNKNSIS